MWKRVVPEGIFAIVFYRCVRFARFFARGALFFILFFSFFVWMTRFFGLPVATRVRPRRVGFALRNTVGFFFLFMNFFEAFWAAV